MSKFPLALQNLIDSLSGLPGVGPKSAERIAISLISKEDYLIERLAKVLEAASTLQKCEICGNIAEDDICFICKDDSRQEDLIIVVESISDLMQIESSFEYKGRFLVLGGLIRPLNGVVAEDLNIDKLKDILSTGQIREVIMALPQTVEGQTTQMYLKKLIQEYKAVEISELARGVPSGASIEYLDFQTIKGALEDRRKIN